MAPPETTTSRIQEPPCLGVTSTKQRNCERSIRAKHHTLERVREGEKARDRGRGGRTKPSSLTFVDRDGPVLLTSRVQIWKQFAIDPARKPEPRSFSQERELVKQNKTNKRHRKQRAKAGDAQDGRGGGERGSCRVLSLALPTTYSFNRIYRHRPMFGSPFLTSFVFIFRQSPSNHGKRLIFVTHRPSSSLYKAYKRLYTRHRSRCSKAECALSVHPDSRVRPPLPFSLPIV